MATLRLASGRSQAIGIALDIGGGPRPFAVFKMTAEKSAGAQLELSFEETLAIVIAFRDDPRFKVGGRPPKPDKSLEGDLEELMKGLKK